MTYNQFREHVLKHLEDYKRKILGIEENGTYREISKGHILPLDCSLSSIKAKEQVVKESNQLKCIKEQPFLIAGHLHRYAHHLNSSQLMCYNFFRPYIKRTKERYCPTPKLVKLLCDNGIKICLDDNAKCQFEYVNQEQEWEDEGEPPRVFIVPDENCKKVFRSEAEID